MSLDNLPVEWLLTELNQVLSVKNGYAFKSKDYISEKTSDDLVPVIRISDIKDNSVSTLKSVFVEKAKASENFKIDKGDLLIAMSGATTGKTGIFREENPAFLNQRVGNLKVHSQEYFLPKFRNFLIQNLSNQILENAYGGAQPNISSKDIESLKFGLPPLAEQQEIVRQLDVMLAQVEQIKARLDAIPAILKKFRQSVLADAVSGKLTEEWRGTSDLSNWQNKTLGDISVVKTGKTPSRKESRYWKDASIPWLTSSATGNNFTDHADEFISEIASKECNLRPFPKGTLLLAMYGEGKTRGQVTELLIDATCNQACAAILVNNEIAHKSFVKIRLLENYENIRKAASGGNQPNLNLNKVREIDIALPPLEEQSEIVQIVKKLFVYADKIEETVQSAQKRVNLLTQSILAKAFSGELTAEWREQHQDLITGVNSVESLLAKIQAEREASKPVKKAKKVK